MPTTTAAAKPADASDEQMMEIGGGALALLALGAGAFALSRRRRRDEIVDEYAYETEPMAEAEAEPIVAEPVAAEPVEAAPRHDSVIAEQPLIVAPKASAFSWGNTAPATVTTTAASEDDGSDRNPGETWVERAYRGPSPANPSVSLKNRLRRAAFFDQRERDVAAGKAEPIDATAGLPEAMVDDREHEFA